MSEQAKIPDAVNTESNKNIWMATDHAPIPYNEQWSTWYLDFKGMFVRTNTTKYTKWLMQIESFTLLMDLISICELLRPPQRWDR